MGKEDRLPLPPKDPIGGGPLLVTELTAVETGVTIRGRFEVPVYAQLDAEQARFLEVFLRSRGMLSGVEKELGLSYPTVRARLDSLLEALDLTPFKDAKREKPSSDKAMKVLDELEKGEITPEEAKRRIRGGSK